MPIRSFDHVAIPIQNTDAMLAFHRALGFGVQDRGNAYSVFFGDNKINFHAPERWQSGKLTLRGPTAVPGCGDFCFVWEGSVDSLKETLNKAGAKIIEGPVQRQGGRQNGRANGTSFYFRDPDSNLLEFMIYPDGSSL
jgi:catechol 2,3-dioxygenase-like lactoylglutathione lyase family enzyme